MPPAQAGALSRTPAGVPARPPLWSARSFWLLALTALLLWSFIDAGLFSERALINPGGWPQFSAFWRAALQPNLNASFLNLTLRATLTTLTYAIAGTALSVVLGAALALPASQFWWQTHWPKSPTLQRAPWATVRALLAIPRGIHELLWGLILINVLGLDPLVAVLAIAIPYGVTIAKLFSEMLDEAPQQAYQALIHSGAGSFKAFLYGLLPIALPDLLSYAFYRFECAIRAAALLGVIGAGGLGYQILLSMQTLDYQETWTLFYALFLLSGLADAWSGEIRRRLGRPDCACAGGVMIAGRRIPQIRNDRFLRGSLLAGLALFPLSLLFLQPEWSLLTAERTQRLWADIVAQALPLNLTPERILDLLQLSGKTLAMSILATSLSVVGGVLFSYPAARNILLPGGLLDSRDRAAEAPRRWRWLWSNALLWITRLALLMLRAIPAPIWALVLLFILFPGILPGAIALGFYNLGVLGRLMAEVTENQNERPARALKVAGAGAGQAFVYGLMPATLGRYTAYSLYRWEISIRATVGVGLVGAGGLGRELTQRLAAFDFSAVLETILFYILLTFLVDLISALVRRTL